MLHLMVYGFIWRNVNLYDALYILCEITLCFMIYIVQYDIILDIQYCVL